MEFGEHWFKQFYCSWICLFAMNCVKTEIEADMEWCLSLHGHRFSLNPVCQQATTHIGNDKSVVIHWPNGWHKQRWLWKREPCYLHRRRTFVEGPTVKGTVQYNHPLVSKSSLYRSSIAIVFSLLFSTVVDLKLIPGPTTEWLEWGVQGGIWVH